MHRYLSMKDPYSAGCKSSYLQVLVIYVAYDASIPIVRALNPFLFVKKASRARVDREVRAAAGRKSCWTNVNMLVCRWNMSTYVPKTWHTHLKKTKKVRFDVLPRLSTYQAGVGRTKESLSRSSKLVRLGERDVDERSSGSAQTFGTVDVIFTWQSKNHQN